MKSLLIAMCTFAALFHSSFAAAHKGCCSCNKFSKEQAKQIQTLLQQEAGSLRQGMQTMCPKKSTKSNPQWKKVNGENPVCFGVSGDQPGRFTISKEGFVAAFKLFHRSGSVTCEKDKCHGHDSYSSKWGCSTNHSFVGSTHLGTFITTQSKRVLFPREKFILIKSMNTWYVLPGFESDSDFLVFHDFANPEFLQENQELQLWYGEDLENFNEDNNEGQTCADVYAWYL